MKLYYNIFIILIFFLNCSKNEINKKKEIIYYPDIVEINYHHYIYKNATKYLHAKIDEAKIYEKLEKIECTKIIGEIYKSNGEIDTKINADSAVIDQKEKKAIFTGNVVFEMIETKSKLQADEIIMDYENNKLFCNYNVIIEKDDGSYLKATSFETNIKTQETKFTKMEIKYFYDEEKEKEKEKSDKKDSKKQ
jgi:LPS export ABC transporter protein LptC